jgi:hypothetical protein
MRTMKSQRWLLICVIGPAFLAGCQLGQSRQGVQPPASSAAASNKTPSAQQPLLTTLVAPAYGGTTTAALVSTGGVQPQAAAQPTQAVRVANLSDPPLATTPAQEPPSAPVVPQAAPADVEVPLPKSLYPRGEPAAPRRSFTDITAHGSFGHAADFTWISGEAAKWRSDWRLRYASVDEVDAHGGSLVLSGDDQLDKLQDGGQYKLIGHIDPHGGKNGGEAFCVEAVEEAH